MIDRLDVGARHHDVVDAHVAELEDGAEHGALFRRERRAVGLVGRDRVLDLRAHRPAFCRRTEGGPQDGRTLSARSAVPCRPPVRPGGGSGLST